MASLDSYIKERNERVERGSLVYGNSTSSTTRTNFDRLNAETFRHNNGAYHDRTRFYF